MSHRLAFRAVFERTSRTLTLAALLAPAACAGSSARAPTILLPLDEPHAVSIMARVFREFGLEPVRNRIIKFGPDDAELRLDVAAKDERFGIAYITWQDADRLGGDLPRRAAANGVVVVRGNGDDDDVHAALLFAADYMQDDPAGEAQTPMTVASEKRLELAARSVLRRAQEEKWP